jgi:hypothetical protein
MPEQDQASKAQSRWGKNDMTDAPEKIWAMASIDAKWSDAHATKYKPCVNDITAPFIFEYTRSDVAQERIAKLEAALPETIAPLVWTDPADCRLGHIYSGPYEITPTRWNLYIHQIILGTIKTTLSRTPFIDVEKGLDVAKGIANAHHRAAITAVFTGEPA